MKNQVAVLKANPIGAIAGGLALYYCSKTIGGITSIWGIGISVAIGAVLGANIQGSFTKK